MAIRSIIVLALLALVVADYKTACDNKAAEDACEYVSDKKTHCSIVDGEKFCKVIDALGAKTISQCSIHSRQGYLGCFSKKEDAPVFQVCVGQVAGSACKYETAASRGNPAFNTTANCIAHYSHGILMCLESVGQPDDEECAGKGVGHPCTHSTSPNAVCSHHSRRGSWMCLAPKEESMVFIVCQGRDTRTACSYTSDGTHGSDSGLIQGQCCPHEKPDGSGHGAMMCIKPEHVGDACKEIVTKAEEKGLSMLSVILIIVGGGFVIIVLSVGVFCIRLHKSKVRVPTTGTVVVGQPCTEGERNNKAGGPDELQTVDVDVAV